MVLEISHLSRWEMMLKLSNDTKEPSRELVSKHALEMMP
jgi:hypothetical protein